MLLYVMTTDGGAREDGNVYYADHLLFDFATESDLPDIQTALAKILSGEPASTEGFVVCEDKGTVYVQSGEDEEADELLGDNDKLIAALAAEGWAATFLPVSGYVVSSCE